MPSQRRQLVFADLGQPALAFDAALRRKLGPEIAAAIARICRTFLGG